MKQTKDAHKIFDKYATEYAALYMDLNQFHPSFDFFCGAIQKSSPAIFEMACGPGNITHYLLSQLPEIQLLGTDISAQMLEIAREINPSARFDKMDCRDIDRIDQNFSGVMSGFVLPYLNKNEVVKLFADVYKMLLPKGVFYLSTMVDLISHSEYIGPSTGDGFALLTHYYDVPFLEKELSNIGFEILDSGYVSSNSYTGAIKDWWGILRK